MMKGRRREPGAATLAEVTVASPGLSLHQPGPRSLPTALPATPQLLAKARNTTTPNIWLRDKGLIRPSSHCAKFMVTDELGNTGV